jgi:hypothetical protein
MARRFRKGQEVVCVVESSLFVLHQGVLYNPPPEKDSIYTVSEYRSFSGMQYISLMELSPLMFYQEDAFQPVADISELIEIAKSEVIGNE